MQTIGFKLISRTPTNVLTLDEVKTQLRLELEDNHEDGDLLSLLEAAVSTAELETERKISMAVYDIKITASGSYRMPWPDFLEIQSIRQGNQVLWSKDDEANPVELAQILEVDDFQELALVSFTEAESRELILRVAFGMDKALIPHSLIQGIRMTLGHYYDNRSEVVTGKTANLVPDGAKRLFHLNRFIRI